MVSLGDDTLQIFAYLYSAEKRITITGLFLLKLYHSMTDRQTDMIIAITAPSKAETR